MMLDVTALPASIVLQAATSTFECVFDGQAKALVRRAGLGMLPHFGFSCSPGPTGQGWFMLDNQLLARNCEVDADVINVATPAMLVRAFDRYMAAHNARIKLFQLSSFRTYQALHCAGQLQVVRGDLEWNLHTNLPDSGPGSVRLINLTVRLTVPAKLA
jgi:hypothetical protein